MKEIVVIDYGFGNFRSVVNMLTRSGVSARSSQEPSDLKAANIAILPGVGSFDAAMEKLAESGWVVPLKEFSQNPESLTVGICLGAQLLGLRSEEGKKPGLGLLEFESRRLPDHAGKAPFIGWNTVNFLGRTLSRPEMPDTGRFYFSHSYFMDVPPDLQIASTDYGGVILPCAVGKGNVLGFQFHPEKSHVAGVDLLGRISRW